MIEREGAQRMIEEPDVAAIEALEQRTAASVEELATASDATTIERAAEVDWDMHQLIVGALRSQLIHDIYRQNRERQRLIGRVYAFHPAKHARAAFRSRSRGVGNIARVGTRQCTDGGHAKSISAGVGYWRPFRD